MLKLQVRDQLMMRNKIRQILWLLCCLPVLTGCIGEDDYANDPRGNFEQLWKIIDEQYCFLDTKGIDWDAVHDEYSKLIIPFPLTSLKRLLSITSTITTTAELN